MEIWRVDDELHWLINGHRYLVEARTFTAKDRPTWDQFISHGGSETNTPRPLVYLGPITFKRMRGFGTLIPHQSAVVPPTPTEASGVGEQQGALQESHLETLKAAIEGAMDVFPGATLEVPDTHEHIVDIEKHGICELVTTRRLPRMARSAPAPKAKVKRKDPRPPSLWGER